MHLKCMLATAVATVSMSTVPACARVLRRPTEPKPAPVASNVQCTVHERNIDFVKLADFPHAYKITDQVDFRGLQFHGFSNSHVPAYGPPGLDPLELHLPVYASYNNEYKSKLQQLLDREQLMMNQIEVDSGMGDLAIMPVSYEEPSVQEAEWLQVNRTWLDSRNTKYHVHAMLEPPSELLQIRPRYLRVTCAAPRPGPELPDNMCRLRVMVQLQDSVQQAEWDVPANATSPVPLDLSKIGDLFGRRVGFATMYPAHQVTTVFSSFSYDIRECRRASKRSTTEDPRRLGPMIDWLKNVMEGSNFRDGANETVS